MNCLSNWQEEIKKYHQAAFFLLAKSNTSLIPLSETIVSRGKTNELQAMEKEWKSHQ